MIKELVDDDFLNYCGGNWLHNKNHIKLTKKHIEQLKLSPIGCIWDSKENKMIDYNGALDLYSFSDGKWVSLKKDMPNINRTLSFLNRALEHKKNNIYIIDLWDARDKKQISPNFDLPIFTYNRKKSEEKNCILVPLFGHHGVNGNGFFKRNFIDPYKLERKKEKCVWRGGLNNLYFDTEKEKNFAIVHSLSMSINSKERDEGKELEILNKSNRYKLSRNFYGSEKFNFALTTNKKFIKISEIPVIKHLFKSNLSIDEQLSYKYMLALGGNDVASSLNWQMQSNSIILKEAYDYEIFIDYFFKEWEDFIPIYSDMDKSIINALDYASKNHQSLEKNIARRHEKIKNILNQYNHDKFMARLLSKYEESVKISLI